MTRAAVTGFFDPASFTISYVVADAGRAAIVDPVLDFDAPSGRTATTSADKLVSFILEKELSVEWILETHVHADHLSAAPYLRNKLGGKTAIGANVTTVQQTFGPIFNLKDLQSDGRQFDHLFTGGETFAVGNVDAHIIYTPGHTPACVTYVIGDAAFVGDTLFMPDFGTARTDFPGGSAAQLYDSIQSIFALPDDTRLFMCHDYKAPGRDEFAWATTVGEQRENNVHINANVSRQQFIETRESRDSQLGMPALILPSIQVNVRGGELPEAEDNDVQYLKIPLNTL